MQGLAVDWVKTDDNLADFFTKKLGRAKFIYFRDILMGSDVLQSYFCKPMAASALLTNFPAKKKFDGAQQITDRFGTRASEKFFFSVPLQSNVCRSARVCDMDISGKTPIPTHLQVSDESAGLTALAVVSSVIRDLPAHNATSGEQSADASKGW